MQDLTPILFLVGIALLFWLLLIRPQARRQRELVRMQSSLEVGDEVMLTSGIYGRITALDEQDVHVEVAAGTTLKVVRGAVGQVVRADEHDRSNDRMDDQMDDQSNDTGTGTTGPEES